MNKKLIVALLFLAVLVFAPVAEVSAKGGGGGGRGGGGGSRSSSSSSRSSASSKSSTGSSSSSAGSSSSKAAPVKPATPKSNSRTTTSSNTKPGSTVTANGKTVKTSTKAPSNSKYKNQAGITGVDGYSPRFSNGYQAPAGSVVYYPQHSFIDYLPWIYLFSQNSPSNDSATVVQPDGKEVVAKPAPEGTDGLAILNWFILILLGVGALVGVVYLVNRFTSK